LGILGFIPENLAIDFIEVYGKTEINESYIKNYCILKNSDAHILTDISEPINYMELKNINDVYDYLKIN